MQDRVDKGLISVAMVLLVGIVVLGVGHFMGNRIAFYVGVLVILMGVFTGIQLLVVRNGSRRIRR
jgi:uncharacterized membrane protein HdeD (DUF308 family)